MTDPEGRKRCPGRGALLAGTPPPGPTLAINHPPRQGGNVRARRSSAFAPQLCFWEAGHLSHLAEGLRALREGQLVPQAEGNLGEKGAERGESWLQAPGLLPSALTALLQ